MTRRHRTANGLSGRSPSSARTTGHPQSLYPAVTAPRLVGPVAEPAPWDGVSHAASTITERRQRQVRTTRRLTPDRHTYATSVTPAHPADEVAARLTPSPYPLAARPIIAPAVLLRRQPFRRYIEESRPYLVLGEGLRMINAHPIAATVFWGGLANWLLRAVLTGHQVAGVVRPLVLTVFLAGWLLITLSRIGKLGELRASVRAIRQLPAGHAVWAGLDAKERSAFGRRLAALETTMRVGAGGSANTVLPMGRRAGPLASATAPEQLAFSWRPAAGEAVQHTEEYGA